MHKPFLDDSYSGLRKNNTDPFVFGDNFWYTNFKQRLGSFTTRLDNFSIILFGTERKNGFYLDTVFVVGKSFSPPFSDRFLKSCSVQLLKTNFLFKNMAMNEDQFYLRYYRGLSFNESSDIFSFSPCKIFSNENFHDRPVLKPYYKFHLQKPGTRTVCVRLMRDKMYNSSLPLDEIKQYWKSIAKECFSQGFALGVSFDLPELV